MTMFDCKQTCARYGSVCDACPDPTLCQVGWPLVLVGFEPDWEALYVEGNKVAEGHHVSTAEVVEHTAEYMGRTGDLKARLETTHIEEDEMNEYGEIDIFDTLAELAEGAPKAYGRISV